MDYHEIQKISSEKPNCSRPFFYRIFGEDLVMRQAD